MIDWTSRCLQTILATLIDAFEVAERDEEGTPLAKHYAIVARPLVKGEPRENGCQLPLRIRAAKRE